MTIAATRDPLEALERYFGFREFLEGQEPVVSALLSGQDALVIMPTGGGKSLCYQLPALVMDGVTVVVSPLIALMKDQVDGLQERGVAATVLNSSLSLQEQRERISDLRQGRYKLVYVAPERFRNRGFLDALSAVDIALFAVDEAHCLSQWGHDFRPDYMRLGQAIEALGKPQTAAFTATATPEVRQDVLGVLGLRDPFVSLSGFERPNLSLTVSHTNKVKEKYERVASAIEAHRTGIVYCATRKRVDEVASDLAARGVRAISYHGGMDDESRSRAQDLFIGRERDVVVATNAFGMGIDRPDVRFVVHFDIPGSIEAYYQEAGRAGRDGEPAYCDLLFNYADTRTQEFFIEGSNPGFDLIGDVYAFLAATADANGEVKMPIQEITDRLGLKNTMGVGSSLVMLARAGHIERFDLPGQRTRGTRIVDLEMGRDALEIDREAIAEKERRDRAKLDAMVKFCYGSTCRQQAILDYFGEDESRPCGSCDICRQEGSNRFRQGDDEEVTRLRKALSGVARTCVRVEGGWKPRYGKGKVVQMLVGSRSKEVLRSQLDELTTYGILRKEGAPYVYELLRAAERAGLVRTEKDGDYPLLGLTEAGVEVMRGGGEVSLGWPELKSTAKAESRGAPSPLSHIDLQELSFDEALFEKLRQERSEIAAEEGGVPAYVIFSNQTLEFFARLKPETESAGRSIRGVGEKKAEKYLSRFLEIIRNHGTGG